MIGWLKSIVGKRKPIRLTDRVLRLLHARFDAAVTNDQNRRHWVGADGLSADAAANAEVRRILRNRARYEIANNSYARGIVLSLANDVIGTGPRLQMLTDDPAAIDGPAIIGGGEEVNGYWLQALAETACRATALAAVSVTAHDPHAASVLAVARLVVARDKRSVAILQEAGCRAAYAPDIAMAHSGDANHGRALVRDWFAEEGFAEPADYAVLAPLGYWTVRENLGAHRAELALYAETVRALGMPCVLLAASTRNPDDRAACYLVREWSGTWRTTVVSRRTPDLHDVIAGAACVISSRLHAALLAVASGVPVVAVSAHPKVTETFASMGRGECVLDPAGATADCLASAVLNAEAVLAASEVEEASRAADAVFAEVLR